MTSSCRNISVLVIMGTVPCLVWLPRFGYMQGCRPVSVHLDTGFICASPIRYYISSPSLDVDTEDSFIFRLLQLALILSQGDKYVQLAIITLALKVPKVQSEHSTT
jgi:hypothetical protein